VTGSVAPVGSQQGAAAVAPQQAVAGTSPQQAPLVAPVTRRALSAYLARTVSRIWLWSTSTLIVASLLA
jgi:hypothetical protein